MRTLHGRSFPSRSFSSHFGFRMAVGKPVSGVGVLAVAAHTRKGSGPQLFSKTPGFALFQKGILRLPVLRLYSCMPSGAPALRALNSSHPQSYCVSANLVRLRWV